MSADANRLTIAMAGHVDHGKSTVIGRLLADTGSLPQGRLEQVQATCARNAKPFEYAFLLDALKDEQAQGITIDAARCFLKVNGRYYLLIDAPGHVEFLKNMITGAARADAMLLVIDAHEGIEENSRRHGYVASMLGVNQISVLVNKMDLVDFKRSVFEAIRSEYETFLGRLNVTPVSFIPVSARLGGNIAQRSQAMPWYGGATVLDQIHAFRPPDRPLDRPFRFPVQDVYKFTERGDDRRLVAGTVETGQIKVGDEVIFVPSGKRSRVRTIEQFNRQPQASTEAGQAVGFTLDTQLYLRPGELMARTDQLQPKASTTFRANLFWLSPAPMIQGKTYKLKVGAVRSPLKLVRILNVTDASLLSSLGAKQQVDRHDVAECILECPKPVAHDLVGEIPQTGRFVVVDQYRIAGAGVILESVADEQSTLRDHIRERELHWDPGTVTARERAAAYHHRPKFVVFTGRANGPATAIAKALEQKLFSRNLKAYYLGLRNVIAGLDADLQVERGTRHEHLRRLGELARIMTDAGQIFITSVSDADAYDIRTLALLNSPNEILVIACVGRELSPDSPKALSLAEDTPVAEAVNRVWELLQEREVIPEYCI